MKYPVHAYARALAAVLTAGGPAPDVAAKNFLAIIRRNGDEAHQGKILEAAGRLIRGKEGVRKVTIESARQLTPAQEALLKEFAKPGGLVERVIDPELVAGVRITMDDEVQFDGSLRGKLDQMFHQ